MPRLRFSLRWLAAPFVVLASRISASTWRGSLTGLAWVAGVGVVITAWALGVPRLQASASRQRFAYQVHVRFIDPPRWFNGDLAAHLIQTAEMNLGGDPMLRDDLVACRETLLQTGWFESIRQVRRVAPNQVEIDAQFVRPYTVVRDNDGDHLVDGVGRLLPLKYEHGAKRTFIAITGVHFSRPQVDEVWEGVDVIAALRVLELIDQQPWRSQVKEIDVTGYLGGAPIRLKTDRNSTLVWGGAPGEEPGLEVLAEDKLKRLNRMFAQYGHIDMGEHGREVDLTDQRYVASREQPDKLGEPAESSKPPKPAR
jgi:hypothetical protein